jgi:protein-tyrosine phosphatase
MSPGIPSSSPAVAVAGRSHPYTRETLSLRGTSRPFSLTKRRAPIKGRSALGRFRVFHPKAATRMAHSPPRVDTAAQGTKRGLSQESDDSPAFSSEFNHRVGYHTGLNPFLCQPASGSLTSSLTHGDPHSNSRIERTEIRKKFEELEWLQRTRLTEGLLANDPLHRWALETDPEIKARNRYLNVQAWANSRIHLRVPEGECDFINASPIVLRDSSTGNERRYIATQVCVEICAVHLLLAC